METQQLSLVRLGLALNAAFSLATGLLLAISPSTVGGWLGLDIDLWFRLLGIGLVGHAGVLAWAINRPNVANLAKLNLLMIAPYPLLMIVVASVIDKGQALPLLDGVIVAAIALTQWAGIRKIGAMPQAQLA